MRRLITGVRHLKTVAPDGHTAQRRTVIRHYHLQISHTRRTQLQVSGAQPTRLQLGHLRQQALRKEASRFSIDYHPATITLHAQSVQHRFAQGFARRRLQWITVQPGEMQHESSFRLAKRTYTSNPTYLQARFGPAAPGVAKRLQRYCAG